MSDPLDVDSASRVEAESEHVHLFARTPRAKSLGDAGSAGVSFIGAGTILAQRGGQTVAGITTAASLLMMAVIGVPAGLRFYALAVADTALTLLNFTVLNLMERRGSPGSDGPEQ